MKKICSIALAALLAFGSVVALASCSTLVDDEDVLDDYIANVLSHTTENGGKLIFEDTLGGTAKVTGYTGKVLENDVVEIPSTVVDSDGDVLLVTGIGKEAFYGLASISEVKIPDTVTYIDDYAFVGCTGLVNVRVVPATSADEADTGETDGASDKADEERVSATIGDYAFQGCSSLVSIEWLSNLTAIGDYAFYGCRSLAALSFPETLESIGQAAFWDCRALTTLDTYNVKTVGIFAFYNCMGLETIYLRDSLTTLGAFDGKENDKDILVSESVFVIKLDENDKKAIEEGESDLTLDIEENYLSDLQNKIVREIEGVAVYSQDSLAAQYVSLKIDGEIAKEEIEEESSSDEVEETQEPEETL